MGKKSREKRERKLMQSKSNSNDFLWGMDLPFEQNTVISDQNGQFNKSIEATRKLFNQYKYLDLAIALNVSELWPANVGSAIKHIFAWRILLEEPLRESQEKKTISSYEEFRGVIQALYQAWPEFPMLEDFCPEPDWGHIKVQLGQDFVPMFYGSCIERTPDFVESFRITYSGIPEAQAHMDLAIALQARVIESIQCVQGKLEGSAKKTYVEVPSEEFWSQCSSSIIKVGYDIEKWRIKAGQELEASLGNGKALTSEFSFSNEVTQGETLPFLAVKIDNAWIPISIRTGPSVVIDYWAKKKVNLIESSTHHALSQFVVERYNNVVTGPITLYVSNTAQENFPVSCIISDNSGVYLICACSHANYKQIASVAKGIYIKVKQGASIRFRLADGRGLMLSKDGESELSAEDLKILLVVTQESTVFGFIDIPPKPIRMLPMTDFITIFDAVDKLEELEQFWKFVNTNMKSLGPSFSGTADLFGAFKSSHGVLVEGASSPGMIWLDPSFGTSSRFEALIEFWEIAPNVFPDSTRAWRVSKGTNGVVVLQSRNKNVVVYSTVVNKCTTQVLVEITPNVQLEDCRMLDLFAQLLADCSYRCQSLMSDISLFHQKSILFICNLADSCSVNEGQEIKPIEDFEHVIIDVQQHANNKGMFNLFIDTQAVCAGLHDAKDGSFEVRCLTETIAKCCSSNGLDSPVDFAGRLDRMALERARYHLQITNRNVDVPDYVVPVIPSSADYKLARKRLALEIKELGLIPGRYELTEAKRKIDPAATQLRLHIESRLASLDKHQLLRAFIEQHDALLLTERTKILRARQSLAHDVEFDRLEAIEKASKEFGGTARHYRYLLEKTLSSSASGVEKVSDDVLRELIGLVDWFMVLTGASDTLHNDIEVGGIVLDDSYIPEVFYSADHEQRNATFSRVDAISRLELGKNDNDIVEGNVVELLSSVQLKNAFIVDLGFDLQSMLTSLVILSQAQRYGFSNDLSLSYSSPKKRIVQTLCEHIDELGDERAGNIVSFLTLSEKGIRLLAGRDVEEPDVPYWEHRKRIHRYAIRPLVCDGENLHWGAETASRALNIWMSAVRDGYLPADFNLPNVEPIIGRVKQGIEKKLEIRTKEIFLRFTQYVEGGIDFFRKFRSEHFEDVGDFDVFAYWPEKNLLITVECKYNQPPHTIKDSRRLRDKIFGRSESDKNGQISKIVRRTGFLESNYSRLLELLKWQKPSKCKIEHIELYVGRDLYYWMVLPPYPVQTKFVTVDTLESWLQIELNK